MKKHIMTAIGLLTLMGSSSFAQPSVSSAGGALNGSSGYAFISIGQTTFNSQSNASGSEHQGILYPYNRSISTSTSLQKVTLAISTFPNPTSDYLYVTCPTTIDGDLSYAFISPDGKTLMSGTLQTSKTKIDISNYPAALYFLKITDTTKNSEYLTYKILKND